MYRESLLYTVHKKKLILYAPSNLIHSFICGDASPCPFLVEFLLLNSDVSTINRNIEWATQTFAASRKFTLLFRLPPSLASLLLVGLPLTLALFFRARFLEPPLSTRGGRDPVVLEGIEDPINLLLVFRLLLLLRCILRAIDG